MSIGNYNWTTFSEAAVHHRVRAISDVSSAEGKGRELLDEDWNGYLDATSGYFLGRESL